MTLTELAKNLAGVAPKPKSDPLTDGSLAWIDAETFGKLPEPKAAPATCVPDKKIDPLPKARALIPYAGKEKPGDNGTVIDDGLSIPSFCKIPASERGVNDKEAMEMTKKRIATAKLPVPPASSGRLAKAATGDDEAEKIVAELAARRKVKARNRVQKMLDKKAGKTTAMPLSGKAAAAAIKAAAPAPKKAAGKVAAAKAPKVAKVKAAKPAKPVKAEKGKGTKTEIIRALLTRKSGCTTAEVLDQTGWPSVSMPAMAKACNLRLRKEKAKGENTRYFGEAA